MCGCSNSKVDELLHGLSVNCRAASIEILSSQPGRAMSETHSLGVRAANGVAAYLTGGPKAGTTPPAGGGYSCQVPDQVQQSHESHESHERAQPKPNAIDYRRAAARTPTMEVRT